MRVETQFILCMLANSRQVAIGLTLQRARDCISCVNKREELLTHQILVLSLHGRMPSELRKELSVSSFQ